MKTIVFTVTNDLNYDQRMQRICTSLAGNGYNVLLVGRKMKHSIELIERSFKQKRLQCFFNTSAFFYAEYNIRLFFFLLFVKTDAVCAIDLDTILPCYFISVLRRKKRIYDAHEFFTEMKEVVTRPTIKKCWLAVERFAVPKFKFGYTVSYSIADEFKKRYHVLYEVIRNVAVKKETMIWNKSGDLAHITAKSGDFAEPGSLETLRIPLRSLETSQSTHKPEEKFILYQGAVNEARGLENLVEAMNYVDCALHIYGDGNLYELIKTLIQKNNLQQKIFLKGKLLPEQLWQITQQAYIGINLVEPLGLNQLYSLANKFFDYIQAGVPQLTMNFPEYKKINNEFEVAVLIDTVDVKKIANVLNLLLNDVVTYKRLQQNCNKAAVVLNWQQEEKKLLEFYNQIFTG